jgi:hypothetical protein
MKTVIHWAALALGLAGCTTEIPVRTEITIDAPRSTVFGVLVDFDRYPDWNPYHVRVAGAPRVGAELAVRVRRPDGKTVDVPHVSVLRLRPDTELTWGGGPRGVFRGEHVFRLEDTPSGGTRLIHTEDFTGLFVGFADLPADVLTEGYNGMNAALKAYIERGAGTGNYAAR